jgi:hypothetical protein
MRRCLNSKSFSSVNARVRILTLRSVSRTGMRIVNSRIPIRKPSELLKNHTFRLVISGTNPTNDSASLIPLLEGSPTTLFCSYPIEDSCLWIRILNNGNVCWDNTHVFKNRRVVCVAVLPDCYRRSLRLKNCLKRDGSVPEAPNRP